MKIKTLAFAILFICISQQTKAQEITMFPGFMGYKYYQDDQQISKKELNSLMAQDPKANKLWKKSKSHQVIGAVLLVPEFGFLLWQLQSLENGDEQIFPFVGVLATGIASIGFSLSSNRLRRKAVLSYNENRDMGSLRIGPTKNGLGIVYQFN